MPEEVLLDSVRALILHHDPRWQRFERRFYALQDQFDDLDPTTLPGLAMTMRVEFARFGKRWAADAMLRPDGPTPEELEKTSHEGHMLWHYIDYLERIAGLREASTAS